MSEQIRQATIQREYVEQTAAMIRARLPFAALTFILSFAVAWPFEHYAFSVLWFPLEHAVHRVHFWIYAIFFALEMLCVLAVALTRRRNISPEGCITITTLGTVAIIVLVTGYHVVVANYPKQWSGEPEILGLALSYLSVGAMLLCPAGAGVQLIVVSASASAFVVAFLAGVGAPASIGMPFLGMTLIGAVSVGSARSLEIYRLKSSQAYHDLKHAEAQLVHSEKMASLGQLVAGVAHELNNPASFVHGGLANLREYLDGFFEVLRAYEQAPIADAAHARAIMETRARTQFDYLVCKTPALLRICSEGSDRIKQIVNDLRVFARADQGERVLTHVVEGIDSTLGLLSDRMTRGNIIVNRDYRKVPPVEAHPGQLNQVWMNLFSNAIDALEGRVNAEISITIRLSDNADGVPLSAAPRPVAARKGSWIEVEIEDNGVGIAPHHREKIFEPFFTTKPIGRGTGLGLSIAYGAVTSHGGTIAVRSELEHGTAVTVKLPLPATYQPMQSRLWDLVGDGLTRLGSDHRA